MRQSTKLQWAMVAEHGYIAASSTDFPWQTLDPPQRSQEDGPEARAAIGHRWQTQVCREEQLQLPISNPYPATGGCQASHVAPRRRKRRVCPM
jgi:hypothetical protein